MSKYIYHGTLTLYGKKIEADWTTGFETIRVGDREFCGYRELLDYMNDKGA